MEVVRVLNRQTFEQKQLFMLLDDLKQNLYHIPRIRILKVCTRFTKIIVYFSIWKVRKRMDGIIRTKSSCTSYLEKIHQSQNHTRHFLVTLIVQSNYHY